MQLEGIVANTHALKEIQETPDTPEALQCVPTLQLSDIPKSITKVKTSRE
jgi:Zn-dependent M16 (insulinase) family peptidase